mgnify:CR=1 FL=1
MHPRVIVLKFGGSVLTDVDSLRLAVHEVYRWRREGWAVVAVVSAFAGRTDELLEKASQDRISADPHAVAAMLSCGERESAAQLIACLDRVGISAALLDPVAISLRAKGPALDACPDGFDTRVVHAGLDECGIVVVPGFLAADDLGRAVTLGRGGSDLTALVLADGLCAERCRLIKDVDGLYEHDPAGDGPPPGRYERVSFDDALALDGSIVQHKAVRFARDHRLSFEVCGLAGVKATEVGDHASRVSVPSHTPPRTRVALLGLGVVGKGVAELLLQTPDRFEIVATSARDPQRHEGWCRCHGVPIPARDLREVASAGADVVVEAIGGVEAARDAIAAALRGGAHVVTANKAVLAEHGSELFALADACQAQLLISASVGGGAPILEAAARSEVAGIRGVLNGTANFVLGRLAIGVALDQAIAEAQELGLAEADPTRDLDGRDAVDKLRVLAERCGIEPRSIDRTRADIREVHPGEKRSQIATLDHDGTLRLGLKRLADHDPIANLTNEWNAVELTFADGTSEVIRGRGAGRWPTAEAVLADVLDLEREILGHHSERGSVQLA